MIFAAKGKPGSLWWFLLPLLFQTFLITVIPAQAFYTRLVGTPVILQTLPVDPYDLLRGYSQNLRYEISRVENLQDLPGWNQFSNANESEDNQLSSGTQLYLTLEAPNGKTTNSVPPQPWQPVAISSQPPQSLSSDRVAIQGEVEDGLVKYGLERYYIPEGQREAINRQIGELRANSNNERSFVVEVKVDPQGNAVLISLWIGDRNYRF